MHWFKKEEVSKMITWWPHKFAWDYFLTGGHAITDDGILINS